MLFTHIPACLLLPSSQNPITQSPATMVMWDLKSRDFYRRFRVPFTFTTSSPMLYTTCLIKNALIWYIVSIQHPHWSGHMRPSQLGIHNLSQSYSQLIPGRILPADARSNPRAIQPHQSWSFRDSPNLPSSLALRRIVGVARSYSSIAASQWPRLHSDLLRLSAQDPAPSP